MEKEYTGKVKEAIFTKTFDSKFGTRYIHGLRILVDQDGTTLTMDGEYLSTKKNQDKFVVGKTVTFTWEENANPRFAAKIKPVDDGSWKKREDTADPKVRLRINKMVAVEIAIDIKLITRTDDLIKDLTEVINSWLNTKEDGYSSANAIRRVVQSMSLFPEAWDMTFILERADKFYNYYTKEEGEKK